MFVITATSGFAARDSTLISPSALMPISITAAPWLSLSLKSVLGSPMSLLKLPSVRSVSYLAESAAYIMSFVEVLPTLPVTPQSFTANRSR